MRKSVSARLGEREHIVDFDRPARSAAARTAIWRAKCVGRSDPEFGRVSTIENDKEPILPSLQEARANVTLAPAKPTGLADLGAPLDDATTVKKGRAHEFPQLLTDGAIGRRFQDLRVIGIKTPEADVTTAKVFVQFEVFGDDTAAPTTESVSRRLCSRARSDWPACPRAACSCPTPISGIRTASCSRSRRRTSIAPIVWSSSRSPRTFARSSRVIERSDAHVYWHERC